MQLLFAVFKGKQANMLQNKDELSSTHFHIGELEFKTQFWDCSSSSTRLAFIKIK